MSATDATRCWDLWLLRALQPTAEAADLDALLAARRRWQARLRDLPAGPPVVDREPAVCGRSLLAGDSALRSGVVLGVQLGPHPCLLEPFLAAGLPVTVVASGAWAHRWQPVVAAMAGRLGRPNVVDWLIADEPARRRRLREVVRRGGPIVTFADDGGPDATPGTAGGLFDTTGRTVIYRLPGREIRVATALARWLCEENLAVHPVAVRWRDDGRSAVLTRQPTQRWSRRHDPGAVTQLLYDWVFHEVAADVSQWSAWSMLAAGILAAAGGANRRAVTPGLRRDYERAFRQCLDRAAALVEVELETDLEVWPGGVLADLTHDRFYQAAGLVDRDLAPLRDGCPTLAALSARRGCAWVETHIQRLCLLGLARLQARA